MSRLNRKLNLSVLSEDETKEIRESHLNKSIGGFKRSIRHMDLQVEAAPTETREVKVAPRYEGAELADVARAVYRENINPKEVKAEYQDEGPNTHASRVNKRSIQNALVGLRNGGDEGKTSYVGPNGGGNVGKYAPTAAGGVGNVTNNVNNYYALTTDMTLEEFEEYTNNKFMLEGIRDHDPEKGTEERKKRLEKKRGHKVDDHPEYLETDMKKRQENNEKARKDLMKGPGMKNPHFEEVILDLKSRLLQLEDAEWKAIDTIMREVAKENYITPKELHKEFKSRHGGQIPDDWVKENRVVEMAGFIPLQELARLNPVGMIYNVTYMYRGGTQRQKFLVPHVEAPSKEEMEQYVRGFWPFARVMTYYPDSLENEQNTNDMVAVPPVSEKYHFYTPEDWVTLTDHELDIYETICQEEGEPLTAPEQQVDGTYILMVSDHDTGENKMIHFGEARNEGESPQDYADRMKKKYSGGKSKTYDPMKDSNFDHDKAERTRGSMQESRGEDSPTNQEITKQGAERQNAVSKLLANKEMNKRMDDAIAAKVKKDREEGRGMGAMPNYLKKEEVEVVDEERRSLPADSMDESYDDPGDERKITRQGAERQNAVAKLMQDKEMQKKMDDAIAKSVARDKARGRVPGLPEPFKLRKREEQKEEFELVEEKDKKSKGSGSKDACYHKVKSRYDVWPSAYASGALVKCRKKGAANWGKSDKKD
jgi:hypothetical protein